MEYYVVSFQGDSVTAPTLNIRMNIPVVFYSLFEQHPAYGYKSIAVITYLSLQSGWFSLVFFQPKSPKRKAQPKWVHFTHKIWHLGLAESTTTVGDVLCKNANEFMKKKLLETWQGNKKPSCRKDSRPYWLTAPLVLTWRHGSRDHLIANMPFHISGPLEPSGYL